jgi:hypothetical protein
MTTPKLKKISSEPAVEGGPVGIVTYELYSNRNVRITHYIDKVFQRLHGAAWVARWDSHSLWTGGKQERKAGSRDELLEILGES